MELQTYLERGDTTGLKVERDGLGDGEELEEIELTEDFGGGGGAFGFWTLGAAAAFSEGLGGAGGGRLSLSSSSDTSGDDENIFRCAFLNSAISRSCFSFLSVMYGALRPASVPDLLSVLLPTDSFSLVVAFWARRLISD